MTRAGVLCACLLALSCGPSQQTTHPGGTGGGGGGGGASCGNAVDTDGDGISDHDEGADEKPARDTDGDGTPDFKDADSDGDGIPDAIEGGNKGDPCFAPADSDGDGTPDFEDLDSDDAKNASLPDAAEVGADPMNPVDTNGDGRPDYLDPDDDGDGIPDLVELTPAGSPVAATKLADAPDTDGDGTPDFRDGDSDGDGIDDRYEGAVDTDGDLTPNFRDTDSDGDCVPDALEAGVSGGGIPVDSDLDGTPDFLDTDTDNDGLVDGKEDKNCNGVVDACETDRKKADSDGDGVSDLIEFEDCAVKPMSQQASCQCDGSNPSSSPLTHGDFVFTVDYQQPPVPTTETLNLSTDLQQADVLFVVDTTGSMSAAITAVRTSLASIASTVQKKVKDIALGVFEFKDFGDSFVTKYDYRITSANTTNSPTVAAVQSALGALGSTGGGDEPEGGWPAMYAVAGGPTITQSYVYGATTLTWTSAIALNTIPPTTPPAGETQGLLGGAGFRSGSVPIIVGVSDAGWHDAYGQAASAADPHAGYWDYGTSFPNSPSRHTTIQLLNGLGAHVIGVAATDSSGATGDSTTRMTDTAYDTGAIATPADFGPVGVRPTGCAVGQCCTGVSGAGIAPDGSGQCPLAFQYNDGDGTGVGDAVSSGIVALANGLKFNIHVEAKDVDPMTVSRFVAKLVPNLSGQGPAAMCVTMTSSPLQDNYTGPQATPGGDGVLDTFPAITNGLQVCFDVVPKENTSVMATDQPQFFHAQLQVKGVVGTNSVNLGTPRDVFFLVPPHIKNGPVP